MKLVHELLVFGTVLMLCLIVCSLIFYNSTVVVINISVSARFMLIISAKLRVVFWRVSFVWANDAIPRRYHDPR